MVRSVGGGEGHVAPDEGSRGVLVREALKGSVVGGKLEVQLRRGFGAQCNDDSILINYLNAEATLQGHT